MPGIEVWVYCARACQGQRTLRLTRLYRGQWLAVGMANRPRRLAD